MYKQFLNTIKEIKDAVDFGHTVKADTDGYTVSKGVGNRYFISFEHSDYCIGLHGLDNTKYANKLNGSSFYILHSSCS